MHLQTPRASRHLRVVGSTLALLVLAAIAFALWYGKAARAKQELERRRAGIAHVMIALGSYDDAEWHLPETVCRNARGEILGSWRFELLKLEGWGAGGGPTFTVPWNAPQNHEFASFSAPWYCHENSNSEERLNTNLVAVAGPGTAFDGEHTFRRTELPPNLIILIEIAHSRIHWAAPGDLTVQDMQESITKGLDGRGVYVGFADLHCWLLRPDVPLSELKKFMTIESAKKSDREQCLGRYVLSRK